MSTPHSSPLDAIDVRTIATGFALGIGILVFFISLGTVIGHTFLVNHGAIPYQ